MRRYLAMLAIAALTLAAACGGGGGGDKSSSKSDSDSKSDKSSSKDDSGSDDSGGSGDESTGNKEIDALLEKQKEAVVKITYENDDGTTYTIAQDPPKFAYLTEDGGGLFVNGDTVVSCSGSGADAQCVELPGGEDFSGALAGFLGPFAAIFTLTDLPGARDTGEEEIAGREAVCVEYSPELFGVSDAGSVTSCIDKETGWTLRWEAKDEDGEVTDSVEATEVGDPDDADFEPPAEPTSLDDLGEDLQQRLEEQGGN